MQKKTALPFALLLALTLALCPLAASAGSQPQWLAELYVVFSDGYAGADHIETYELGYAGTLTPQLLANGLTSLTGLDFTINQGTAIPDGVIVDWSSQSALLAGPGDTPMQDPFIFHDADTLSAFMLDSMAMTMRANLHVNNVYFTMDGGQELVLPELFGGPFTLPADEPYQTSGYYRDGGDISEPTAAPSGEADGDTLPFLQLGYLPYAVHDQDATYYDDGSRVDWYMLSDIYTLVLMRRHALEGGLEDVIAENLSEGSVPADSILQVQIPPDLLSFDAPAHWMTYYVSADRESPRLYHELYIQAGEWDYHCLVRLAAADANESVQQAIINIFRGLTLDAQN